MAVLASAGAIAAGLLRLDALHETAAGSSKRRKSDRDEAVAPRPTHTRRATGCHRFFLSVAKAVRKKPQSAVDEFASANTEAPRRHEIDGETAISSAGFTFETVGR